MNAPNPKVDFYFDKADAWQQELNMLRTIALDSGLTEELKWGVPCYTLQGKNVALIHAFKEYCAMMFIKGALLSDAAGLLIQQTDQVQAGRQARFTGVPQIAALQDTIQAYLHEAMAVEEAGLHVPRKETSEYPVPEEFREALAADAELRRAFEALTPGRQRGYLLHFAAPKQARTRAARIEKCAPQIFAGKGLND